MGVTDVGEVLREKEGEESWDKDGERLEGEMRDGGGEKEVIEMEMQLERRWKLLKRERRGEI